MRSAEDLGLRDALTRGVTPQELRGRIGGAEHLTVGQVADDGGMSQAAGSELKVRLEILKL